MWEGAQADEMAKSVAFRIGGWVLECGALHDALLRMLKHLRFYRGFLPQARPSPTA